VQVLEAKGKKVSLDVLVEAVACVVTPGVVDTIQLGDQGHPQGSSSATLPSPSLFQYASNRPRKRFAAILQLN
jgi:hypothetical protein